MNKLWVRLSLSFFGVMTITTMSIFSMFFVVDWVNPLPLSPSDFEFDYYYTVIPFVENYIIEGKSDAEIIKLLDQNTLLQDILHELRADSFASDVDIENRSFKLILESYLFEISNPFILLMIFIGSLIGIIMSIFVSRQLTAPLSQLTEASYALGQQDLTQRVDLRGSVEINKLVSTFNDMAERLERAHQLRQGMLADVSHELRTPLAGLEGMLRATLDGVFPLDNQHISNLYTQTRHLTSLVEDLYLLARAESGSLHLNKSEINLTKLLGDLVQVFTILAHNKNVELTSEFNPTCHIFGDAIRIRQILSNLIINALHHTPSGGQISLTLNQIGREIEIKIIDNGAGIPVEHLPHLFNRFYRVDPSRNRETGRTGLGLAIVKALADAQDGSIYVESDGVNQGSVFRVLFPCYESK